MTGPKRQAGFTLLETILSLALTALIVGMIAIMTRQWLIDWNRGADRIAQIEAMTLAENRLAIDLEGTLAFPFHPENPDPTFIGNASEIFVLRAPTQRDGTDRLMVVRYQSHPDLGVTRSTAIYDHATSLIASAFSDTVTLLPSPYQITFSYRDSEGRDDNAWHDRMMPDIITIHIIRPDGRRLLSYPIEVRTKLAASCARVLTMKDCILAMQSGKMPPAQPVRKSGQQIPMQDNTGKLQP